MPDRERRGSRYEGEAAETAYDAAVSRVLNGNRPLALRASLQPLSRALLRALWRASLRPCLQARLQSPCLSVPQSPLPSLRPSLPGSPDGVTPIRSRAVAAGGARTRSRAPLRAFLLASTVTVALAAVLGACDTRRPAEPAPVMPQAVPVQVPGDISSERLALVVDEVSEALKPRFGPLASVAYRVPEGVDWAQVEAFYAQALAEQMKRLDGVYREGRRHRLAVWSADGRADGAMLAVAFLGTPVSGEPATHGVLVLITPAAP